MGGKEGIYIRYESRIKVIEVFFVDEKGWVGLTLDASPKSQYIQLQRRNKILESKSCIMSPQHILEYPRLS